MNCNPRVQGMHGFLQQQQNESTSIPKTQKKPKKIFIFGVMPYAKMRSAKKNAKIIIIFAHFCPIWMLSQIFCYN